MGNFAEKISEEMNPSREKIRNHTEPEEEDTISYFQNEKLRLVTVLDNLSNNLKKTNKQDLSDIYIDYLKNESISKRKIKDDLSNCSLIIMFYIIAPLLTVINLIGIFQIKTIMDELFGILKNVIVMYFTYEESKNEENKNITDYSYLSNYTNVTNNFDNNTYNFYKSLYFQAYDRTINFDLIMIMNFLGFMALKSRGFSMSTIIFLVINILGLFMAYNFDFDSYDEETKKFSFSKILYLIGCFAILYIGVGASTLLSQQILVDSYDKLEDRKKLLNSKSDSYQKINNDNSKMLEDKNDLIEITENKEQLIEDEVKKNSEEVKAKDISSNSPEEKKSNMNSFFMVCLTTIIGYFGKYYINILLIEYEINNEKEKNYLKFYYFVVGIYFISMILSLIFYLIFKTIFVNEKKSKEKKDEYNIYQICGYTIYTENKILRKTTIPKHEFCKLCCNTFDNCCETVLCNYCRRGGCCHCFCCLLYCLGCCSFKGNCDICRSDDVDYTQNEGFFCYCYQGRRKCYWIYKYLTSDFQRDLTPKLFIYFLIQLMTIGFESLFNIENEKKKEKFSFEGKETLIMAIIFISTFIVFLLICISYGKMSNLLGESESKSPEKISGNIKDLSNQIVDGMYGILIFNGIYSLVLSSIYFSLDNKSTFTNDHYFSLYIPILMSKFFYFSLNYYAVSKSEETKGFELISGSISISIYLLIWNIIYEILISYLSENSLFVLQILFAVIVCNIFLLLICFLGLIMAENCRNFLYMQFMIFCCGGLFISTEEEKGKCCSLYCDNENYELHCLYCECGCCTCEY